MLCWAKGLFGFWALVELEYDALLRGSRYFFEVLQKL